MAIILFLSQAAGAVISPVTPARSVSGNTYPLTYAIEGTITAGSVIIEESPTQELVDWVAVFTANPGTALTYLGHIDYPVERIRARTSADFQGSVSVFLVPGA